MSVMTPEAALEALVTDSTMPHAMPKHYEIEPRTIDEDLRLRINQIIAEMNRKVKERAHVIHGLWVGRVAQQHVLMVGPGGTGKSFLQRDMCNHISGSIPFEVALDETTDPSQTYGPPDIKAMVEEGKTRHVITGMLPEATDAFLDEIFNGNTPLLHSLMPPLNERIFHNNGMPIRIPLRQVVAGTNKLTADVDQAAFWDRIHLRFSVDYLVEREAQKQAALESVIRNQALGRSNVTMMASERPTLVTLDELDRANKESLSLGIPDAVLDTFFDLKDELEFGEAQVRISTRRVNESMFTVMANAWLRGHKDVQVVDLDILASMWWNLLEQQQAVRAKVLEITNPSEKAAYELLKELEKMQDDLNDIVASDQDERRKKNAAVQSLSQVQNLAVDAEQHLASAKAAGLSTVKLEEVLARCDDFKIKTGQSLFGIDPSKIANRTS